MTYGNKKTQNNHHNNRYGSDNRHYGKNTAVAESIYNAYAFRNPMEVGMDGVHFINIHPQAVTRLGIQLNFDYELPFLHPDVSGKIKAMASFQKWIRSTSLDERIKNLTGKSLYNFKDKVRNDVPNYKAIVIEAWWHQITSYSELVKAIIDTRIKEDSIKDFLRNSNYSGDVNYYPFDIIYADMERRCLYRPFDIQQFNVIIEGIKHIRESLIANDKELILPDEFYTNRSISTKEAIYGIGYEDHFENFVSNSRWNIRQDVNNKSVKPKPYEGEIPEDLFVDEEIPLVDTQPLVDTHEPNIGLNPNQEEEKTNNGNTLIGRVVVIPNS